MKTLSPFSVLFNAPLLSKVFLTSATYNDYLYSVNFVRDINATAHNSTLEKVVLDTI